MIAKGRVTHEDVFHALHEVATAAAAGAEPVAIAQLAATRCRALLDADGSGVRWLEQSAGELRLLAADAREPMDHPATIGLHGSLVGRAVLEGASLIVDDCHAELGALHWAVNTGIASLVVVPLLVGQRAVGAISVFSYSPRAFTADEQALVELLAAVIGPTLESARVAGERAREAGRLTALHAFAVAAAGELDLARLADIATVQAIDALGCDAASIVLWDQDQKVLRVVTGEGRFGLGPVVPEGSQAIRPCFDSGEPVVMREYGKQFDSDQSADLPALVACVPLSVDGRVIGCLVVANKSPREFGIEEVTFMTLLAAQLSPALEAARLSAEVARSEGRLRRAYEVMSCAVVYGRRGHPVELNQAALDILGPEAALMMNGPGGPEVRMWDEDGTTLAAEDIPNNTVRRTGTAIRGRTYRVQVGSGRAAWIH